LCPQVSTSISYNVAEFNEEVASNLYNKLRATRYTIMEGYSRELYKAEVRRLQIEDFVYNVMQNNNDNELKQSLNILFSFHRQYITDKKFLEDIRFEATLKKGSLENNTAIFFPSFRHWLGQLVAVMLSKNQMDDNVFLLNHLMRCPGGVGSWGAHFIQPKSPNMEADRDDAQVGFENPLLEHLLTMMATLMLPVKQREEFLKELKIHSAPNTPTGSRYLCEQL
jgi:hypothetical protein